MPGVMAYSRRAKRCDSHLATAHAGCMGRKSRSSARVRQTARVGPRHDASRYATSARKTEARADAVPLCRRLRPALADASNTRDFPPACRIVSAEGAARSHGRLALDLRALLRSHRPCRCRGVGGMLVIAMPVSLTRGHCRDTSGSRDDFRSAITSAGARPAMADRSGLSRTWPLPDDRDARRRDPSRLPGRPVREAAADRLASQAEAPADQAARRPPIAPQLEDKFPGCCRRSNTS